MNCTHATNEFTGALVTCKNCGEAPPHDGFDECTACAVAITMDEDAGYIEVIRPHFSHLSSWAKFEREWIRQASALIECGMMVAA